MFSNVSFMVKRSLTTIGLNGGGSFLCSRSSQLIDEKKSCPLTSFCNKWDITYKDFLIFQFNTPCLNVILR